MPKQKNYPDPSSTETENVVSSTDCTGLVQMPPLDEAQARAYKEIYPVNKA